MLSPKSASPQSWQTGADGSDGRHRKARRGLGCRVGVSGFRESRSPAEASTDCYASICRFRDV